MSINLIPDILTLTNAPSGTLVNVGESSPPAIHQITSADLEPIDLMEVLFPPAGPVINVTGDGSQTASNATNSGVGSVPLFGDGSQTVTATTQAGVGALSYAGDGSQIVTNATNSGVGLVELFGDGSQSAQGQIQDGTGVVGLYGVGLQVTTAATQDGVGQLTYSANGYQIAQSAIHLGSGLVEVFGDGSQTAQGTTNSGTGFVTLIGDGSQTAQGNTQAGVGFIVIYGNGSQTASSQTELGLPEVIYGDGFQIANNADQYGLHIPTPITGDGVQTAQSQTERTQFVEKVFDIKAVVSTAISKIYDLKATVWKAYDLEVRIATQISKVGDTKTRVFLATSDTQVTVTTAKSKDYDTTVDISTQATQLFDIGLDVTNTVSTDFDLSIGITETSTFDITLSVSSVGVDNWDFTVLIQPDLGPNPWEIIPEIYRDLDTEDTLRNFLGALWLESRDLEALTTRLFYLTDIDKVSIEFLDLLGGLIDRPYDYHLTPKENRKAMKRAVAEYKIRGSIPFIKWLGFILGDKNVQVQEMYDSIMRLSECKLGDFHRLRGEDNDYGRIKISSTVDISAWKPYLKILQPAGTVFSFTLISSDEIVISNIPTVLSNFGYEIHSTSALEDPHTIPGVDALLSGFPSHISEGEITISA